MMVEKFNDLAKATLSPKRYQHSVAVADCAAKLAERFGINIEKARLAGLAHDITREFTHEEQERYAKLYHVFEAGDEQWLEVLHGRTAPFFIQEKLNFYDEEVASAVCKHTICGNQMSSLDKIIYIADGITPGHPLFTQKEATMLATLSLDELFYAAMKSKIDWCYQENKKIYPTALEWYKKLAKEQPEKNANI